MPTSKNVMSISSYLNSKNKNSSATIVKPPDSKSPFPFLAKPITIAQDNFNENQKSESEIKKEEKKKSIQIPQKLENENNINNYAKETIPNEKKLNSNTKINSDHGNPDLSQDRNERNQTQYTYSDLPNEKIEKATTPKSLNNNYFTGINNNKTNENIRKISNHLESNADLKIQESYDSKRKISDDGRERDNSLNLKSARSEKIEKSQRIAKDNNINNNQISHSNNMHPKNEINANYSNIQDKIIKEVNLEKNQITEVFVVEPSDHNEEEEEDSISKIYKTEENNLKNSKKTHFEANNHTNNNSNNPFDDQNNDNEVNKSNNFGKKILNESFEKTSYADLRLSSNSQKKYDYDVDFLKDEEEKEVKEKVVKKKGKKKKKKSLQTPVEEKERDESIHHDQEKNMKKSIDRCRIDSRDFSEENRTYFFS